MTAECYTCGKEYSTKNNLQRCHYMSTPSHTPPDWDECHECGCFFESIGIHWTRSSCSYPTIPKEKMKILTGLLMGDGWIERNGSTPRIGCRSVTKDYLVYLDSQFPTLGTGVSLDRTAEESIEDCASCESGFETSEDPDNFQDIYRWVSRTHPRLLELEEWYSSGKKQYPEDLELAPTVLKNWYCGDGSYNNYSSNNYITIGCKNEMDNKEKIEQMFIQSGLPTPNHWGSRGYVMRWTVKDSQELFEYMGEPLPGFEYKWPDGF